MVSQSWTIAHDPVTFRGRTGSAGEKTGSVSDNFYPTRLPMTSNFSRRHALKLLGLAALSSQLDAATDKPMKGIFPIMATPYTSSNQVDYEDLEKEVEFMTRCGANGMVWPQHASELLYLSREERRRGMRVLAKAIKGKKPALILGVQAATKEDAVEYAELAEELSPDAVIAMPPTGAKSLDDYRDYYRTLARITKRPFFIQTTGGAPDVDPTVVAEVLLDAL